MSARAGTLLLSHSYEPLRVISWQRAIRLLTKGRIEVLSSYDGFLRSSTVVIKIPAVARLLRAFKRFRKPVKFSRINVYSRDGYKCGYCGERKPIDELTFDHVVPRSQGGKTEWLNVTSACSSCNHRKGGRTPAQAGMRLLRQPTRPNWIPAITLRLGGTVPEQWRDYCYWNTELSEE